MCDGTSGDCPTDGYLVDGIQCGLSGNCWKGNCSDSEQQCKRLWGEGLSLKLTQQILLSFRSSCCRRVLLWLQWKGRWVWQLWERSKWPVCCVFAGEQTLRNSTLQRRRKLAETLESHVHSTSNSCRMGDKFSASRLRTLVLASLRMERVVGLVEFVSKAPVCRWRKWVRRFTVPASESAISDKFNRFQPTLLCHVLGTETVQQRRAVYVTTAGRALLVTSNQTTVDESCFQIKRNLVSIWLFRLLKWAKIGTMCWRWRSSWFWSAYFCFYYSSASSFVTGKQHFWSQTLSFLLRRRTHFRVPTTDPTRETGRELPGRQQPYHQVWAHSELDKRKKKSKEEQTRVWSSTTQSTRRMKKETVCQWDLASQQHSRQQPTFDKPSRNGSAINTVLLERNYPADELDSQSHSFINTDRFYADTAAGIFADNTVSIHRRMSPLMASPAHSDYASRRKEMSHIAGRASASSNYEPDLMNGGPYPLYATGNMYNRTRVPPPGSLLSAHQTALYLHVQQDSPARWNCPPSTQCSNKLKPMNWTTMNTSMVSIVHVHTLILALV